MTTAAQVDLLIGKRARLALAHARDGVYVPINPKPTSPLVAMIGMGNAMKLAQIFGGGMVHLCKDTAKKLERRNSEMKEAAQLGATQRALAKEYGLTTRQVSNILKSS